MWVRTAAPKPAAHVWLLLLISRNVFAARPLEASVAAGVGGEALLGHHGSALELASRDKRFASRSGASTYRVLDASSAAAAIDSQHERFQAEGAAHIGSNTVMLAHQRDARQQQRHWHSETLTGEHNDERRESNNAMTRDSIPDSARAESDAGGTEEVNYGAQTWYAPLLAHRAAAGGVMLAVFVGVAWYICSRKRGAAEAVASTHAGGAADEAPPANEQEAVARDIAKFKKQRNGILMEQFMQKQRLEKVLQAMQELEARQQSLLAPTDEQVAKKASAAVDAADLMVAKGLFAAVAYTVPAQVQLHRLQALVDRRTTSAHEKVLKMARTEARGVLTDVEETFELTDLQGGVVDALKNIKLPSVALLLAGMIAPVQLKLIVSKVQGGFYKNCVFTFLSLAVIGLDIKSACQPRASLVDPEDIPMAHGSLVYLWFELDAVLGALTIMAGYWVCSAADTSNLADPMPTDVADEPLQVLRHLLDYYTRAGAEALLRFDAIMRSVSYIFLQCMNVILFLWMMLAIDIIINTGWRQCPRPSLVLMRFRVFYFMVALIPNLIDLVGFFVSRYTSSVAFQLTVIGAAERVDAFLQTGVPIFTVCAQAALVRKQEDVINMQLRQLEKKKELLVATQEDSQRALDEALAEQAPVDTELLRLREERDNDDLKSLHEQTDAKEQDRLEILASAEALARRMNNKALEATKIVKVHADQIEKGEGAELYNSLVSSVEAQAADLGTSAQLLASSVEAQAADLGTSAQLLAASGMEAAQGGELYDSMVAAAQVQSQEFGEAFAAASAQAQQLGEGVTASVQESAADAVSAVQGIQTTQEGTLAFSVPPSSPTV